MRLFTYLTLFLLLVSVVAAVLPEFEVTGVDPLSACTAACQKEEFSCEQDCSSAIPEGLTAQERRDRFGPCSQGCLDREASCHRSCSAWASIPAEQRPSPQAYREQELGSDDLEDSADSDDVSDKELVKPLSKNDLFEQLTDLMQKKWSKQFSDWKTQLQQQYEQTRTTEIRQSRDDWEELINLYHDAEFRQLDLIEFDAIEQDINQLEFMYRNRNHLELELDFDDANKLRAALGALYVQRARARMQEAVEDLLTEEQAKRVFTRTKLIVTSTHDTSYDPDADTIYLNTIWETDLVPDNAKIWRDVQENGGEDLVHEMSHVIFEAIMDENSAYHSWDKSRLSRLRRWSANINPWDDYEIYRRGQDKLGGTHGLETPAETEMFAFNEAGSHFTAYALASDEHKDRMLATFSKKPPTTANQNKALFEKNIGYVLMELYHPENQVITTEQTGGAAQLKDYFTTVEAGLGDDQITIDEFIAVRRTMPGWNEERWIALRERLEAEGRI